MATENNCNICNKKLEETENSLLCDFCGKLFHAKCCEIPAAKAKSLIAVREMVTWFCPTCSKLKPLDKLNIVLQTQNHFEKRLTDLSNEVTRMKEDRLKCNLNLNEIEAELGQRNAKKKNVAFSGLPAHFTKIEQIVDIITTDLGIAIENAEIEKLNVIHPKENPEKPIVIVSFTTEKTRDLVLHNAKKLRKSDKQEVKHAFINPDYTFQQRKDLQQLGKDLQEKRAEGLDVIIRNFKIITNPNPRKKIN